MRIHSYLISLLLFAVANSAAVGQMYWDIDTQSIAGSGGGAAPSGTWNTSLARWNVNFTGSGIPTIWTPGSTAIFSAGTNATGSYTITISGTQSLAGLTVEEGTVTQNGGTLSFGSEAASIYVDTGAAWGETSSGVITGTGGIYKNGAGLLSLRGSNTFSRSGSGNQPFLTLKAGIVDFVSDANLGAVPSASDNAAALTFNGGTLRYNGITTLVLASKRGVYIDTNGGTIDVATPNIVALSASAPTAAAFSGSGTFTKTGVGRFELQTAQTTFTGKYIVKAGSLAFWNQNQLGAIPAATQSDYFTLDGGGLYGDSTTGITLDAKRGITLGLNGGYLAFTTAAGLLPYDGIISGSQGGALRIATNDAVTTPTTGITVLNAANTYDGPTQIDNGATLAIRVLANGGTNSGIGFSSNAASNLIFSGGMLSYFGPSASTDRNFTLTQSGGYLDASSTNNSTLTFASTAPVTFVDNTPHLLTLSGLSTGDNSFSPALADLATNATSLKKTGAGTWVLKNTANSYTGNTILDNGRLKLGAAGVIPDTSLVQFFAQSVLDLNGFDETARSISGVSGTLALGAKSLTVNSPNAETYAAAITGTGGGRIIKNGAGKLTLSPPTATYDGGLTLNAGSLGAGTNTALGTGTLVVNNSPTLSNAVAAALTLTNAVTLNGNLTFDNSFITSPGTITWGTSGAHQWTITGGPRTITVNSTSGAYGVTINQSIGEDAVGRALVKAGNGTLTLGAVNTYTGNTTVQAGTLSLAKPSLADSSAVLLAAGATLNLNFPSSTPDIVNALYLDGVLQSGGFWGAVGSAAANQTALITGTGVLLIGPLPPGDFNADGKVDAGDYLTWRKNYGTNIPLPNSNGLGAPIGDAHLLLWRQHFGETAPSPSPILSGAASVPEPNSIAILVVGIAALATRRLRPRN